MRALRAAEKAGFRAAADVALHQTYVCRSCRLDAVRQIHTTHQRFSEQDVSFMRRVRDTIFGSKESRTVEASREKRQQQQLEDLKTKDSAALKEVKIGADGREYEVAAVIDPSRESDYVQSSTWEQLERVGGDKWVRSRQDRGEKYTGFMTSQIRRELTDARLKLILFHISVEVLALYNAGRDLSEFSARSKTDEIERHENAAAVRRSVIIPADGGLGVQFETEEQRTRVLESLTKKDSGVVVDANDVVKDAQRIFDAGQVESLRQYKNEGIGQEAWLNLSLADPHVKLAVIKRLVQLTGLLGDNFLGIAMTMGDLYDALKKRPQAIKVLKDESVIGIGQRMPNVTIQKQQRLIDKETRIGRWKLIEEELNKRDLPVPVARTNARQVRPE